MKLRRFSLLLPVAIFALLSPQVSFARCAAPPFYRNYNGSVKVIERKSVECSCHVAQETKRETVSGYCRLKFKMTFPARLLFWGPGVHEILTNDRRLCSLQEGSEVNIGFSPACNDTGRRNWDSVHSCQDVREGVLEGCLEYTPLEYTPPDYTAYVRD